MSFYYDKQVKGYGLFLLFFSFFILGMNFAFHVKQIGDVKGMYVSHEKAIASSLLAQDVPEEVIADALTGTGISEAGELLLSAIGIGEQPENHALPFFFQFWRKSFLIMLIMDILFISVLFVGTFHFAEKRKRLYQQAEDILENYLDGDFSCHLPQNKEGLIFQLFSSVERLATMLQSKNEGERSAKEFLKRTISDISHQLKTPLAALAMYQEIIESEAENTETVKEFSAKAGMSLKRMEQLISSMLKITRLDAGNIVFVKKRYPVTELIACSIRELTTRAKAEQKEIVTVGDDGQTLLCDMEWTSEAIGNIVKNALDHTGQKGVIRIAWEQTAAMLRIVISDNGSGIAVEDIHHIFKRFYRSKRSLDTQGAGLGLPLAKAIIEEQGGIISVQSIWKEGTVFTLSFLTKP